MTAKSDDLSITIDSGPAVVVTMLAEETLHQPRLCMTRIYVEDSVQKNLRDAPAFFGDCAGNVAPVDADHRVLTRGVIGRVRFEESDREHCCLHER